MHATVDALTKEYDGVVSVLLVDATKEHGLVGTFKVQSVPTYILVKEGQEKGRVCGADKQALKELFASHAAPQT
jgi:thioredoxin-like negative regulator of GroEL